MHTTVLFFEGAIREAVEWVRTSGMFTLLNLTGSSFVIHPFITM